MMKYNISPLYLINNIWSHRVLIAELAKREIIGRYKGSFLGIFWSFAAPLLMLTIYTFVFSRVFKMKWNSVSDESQVFLAIVLFTGLIFFNLFSECIGKAPCLIINNVNFVKKVVFPLEILPCVNLVSALFHALVSLSILLFFQFASVGSLSMTTIQIFLVILPFLFLIVGCSWILSAAGVYLRDINQTVGLMLSSLMFISPIFFPISSLPTNWHSIVRFNPLAIPIEHARRVLIYNQSIIFDEWLAYTSISLFVAWFGFYFFQKTRKGFADVL